MVNVFLAGKVDRQHGAWRGAIVGEHYVPVRVGELRETRWLPRWVLPAVEDEHWDGDMAAKLRWPKQPNAWVLGRHNYVGPYRRLSPNADPSWYGEFHGNYGPGSHGQPDASLCEPIVEECLAGIRRADVVLAVVNTPDCFGTLAEIGYAHAMAKFVYLITGADSEWEWDDYWYVDQLATVREYAPDDGMADPVWIRGQCLEAINAWAAIGLPNQRPVPVPVPMTPDLAVASFVNIARWTSDPRVRDEAQRMVQLLTRQGQSSYGRGEHHASR